jgi:uncharacterized membrane protein
VAGKQRSESSTQVHEERGRAVGLLWLWAGVLLAPLAFLSHLQVNYTLTQKLCPGGRTLPLHVMTLVFLLITALGCLIAWRSWRRVGKGLPDDAEDKQTRVRFLAVVGMMLGLLSFLIIIAQWIPQFIFDPCQR